jgi:hypothetical protein
MITGLIIVGGVYVVSSYIFMFQLLQNNAGPGGLGWLALPLAPLVGPKFVVQGFRSFFKRVFS